MEKELNNIVAFVKYNREKLNLTQEKLAEMTDVGIHFIRDLEQGKSLSKVDKVNKVLSIFGYRLAPVLNTIDPYEIWAKYFNKAVEITTKQKQKIYGFIVKEIRDETNKIVAWQIVPNPNAIQWQKSPNDDLTIEIKQDEIAEIDLQKYEKR